MGKFLKIKVEGGGVEFQYGDAIELTLNVSDFVGFVDQFSNGYVALGFKTNKQHTYSCHRIIWLMHNLDHPKVVKTQEGYVFPDVDHEDQNPLNNDKDNLRLTTVKQNQGNAKLRKDNTSGVTGVYRIRDKYKVEIAKKYYGFYHTEEEAEAVAIKIHKKVFGKFSKYWKKK